MDDYRLEACSVCQVVRLALVTAITHQRMADRTDRPVRVGGATVWQVDFCDPCRRAYEASFDPEPTAQEAQSDG